MENIGYNAVMTNNIIGHSRNLYAALLLGVLLISGGCASGNGNATAAPTLTAAPVQSTPLPDIKTYVIDNDNSIIRFQSTLTVGNVIVNGTFNTKGKTLTVSTQGKQTHIDINLQIDGNSVTSPGNLGVGILKSMLDTKTFPYALLTAGVDLPTANLGATPAASTANGTLELHGRTQPVEVPVIVSMSGNQVVASGTITLELTDYGVVVPALIKSKITLQAEVVAQLPNLATTAAAAP